MKEKLIEGELSAFGDELVPLILSGIDGQELVLEKKVNFPFKFDLNKDPYLLLTDEIKQPPGFNEKRPGEKIMMHGRYNGDELSDFLRTTQKILENGFVLPRNYSSMSGDFSASSNFLTYGEPSLLLIYRSYSRWTREPIGKDPFGHTGLLESMIGIREEVVNEICPEGVKFHLEKTLFEEENNQRVWAYTPPEHLTGMLQFPNKDEAGYITFDVWMNILREWEKGAITELEAKNLLDDLCSDFIILDDGKLMQSMAGSMTENKLMKTINYIYKGEKPLEDLKKLQTSYDWTRNLQDKAVDFFEKAVN